MEDRSAKTRALALPVLLAAALSNAAAQPAQTIILVRHAERAGGMVTDVPISEEGRARAAALSDLLADAKISAIFVSEVARTQQTAEPLATRLKIRPEVIPARDIETLVTRLRTGKFAGPVLVVGHSDTIPTIIEQLGAGPAPAIADNQYDRLFIVTLTGPKSATLVTLHYPGRTR